MANIVKNPLEIKIRNSKQIQNSNIQNSKQKLKTICCCCFCFGHLDFGNLDLFETTRFRISCFEFHFILVLKTRIMTSPILGAVRMKTR
jgi:hypothetical protein